MFFIVLHLTIVILSLVALIKGSEWLMKGAVAIAEAKKISKLAIASTIIAFGTALPTIAANVALSISGGNSADAAVGTTLGTNYVNIGLALGISAFLVTIVTKYNVFEKEIPIYLAITSLYTAFALDGGIELVEGIILLFGYFGTLFLVYQYSIREKIKDSDLEEIDVDTSTVGEVTTKGVNMIMSIGYVILGLFTLLVFSLVLAQMSPILSKDLKISEYILGLTVIGIGTSLPTIVTSIRSALKGYTDILLGNVFGSTIANICLGFGIPALFGTIHFNEESISDTYFYSIFNIVVLFLILIEMKLLGRNGVLNRISGVIIVGIYLVYLGSKLFL